MFVRAASWLDSRLGLSCEAGDQSTLLREQFLVLKRQLPWVHCILLANLLGVVFALQSHPDISKAPALLLAGVILVRAALWRQLPLCESTDRALRREMRRTFLVALLFCVGSLAWNLSVYLLLSGEDRLEIGTFAGLAAIGTSYGLSSFRAAARVPLLLLGVPFGCLLAVSPNAAHVGIGLSFLIVIVVWFALLNIQNNVLAGLVSSRSAVEVERRRAVYAESVAVAEHARVETVANTDSLTGLSNRRGLLAALEAVHPEERKKLALIMLDLDGFKPVNDTFGHRSGDCILVEVSVRLRSFVPPESIVARLGGDEFAILLQCKSAGEALLIGRRAIDRIEAPFALAGQTMMLSACAGVSYQHDSDVMEAMLRADLALYEAKAAGRGNVSLFCNRMQEHVQRRASIEQALRGPSQLRDIRLCYQPIVDLASFELKGFEALARWQHPDLGTISPGEFIPITEQINVLPEISDALLHQAAADAAHWPESALLSFNLSAVQLCTAGTAQNLLDIIARQGLHPRRLQIEVTETALLADFETARRNLSALSSKGVRIALDDFGAGYASITYLREMRFDCLKLDGSLISPITGNGTGVPLLKGVLALCDALNQDCVAEHVETAEEVQLLRHLGCRYAQGFALSPPIDAESATRFCVPPVPFFGRPARQSARRAPAEAAVGDRA